MINNLNTLLCKEFIIVLYIIYDLLCLNYIYSKVYKYGTNRCSAEPLPSDVLQILSAVTLNRSK